MESPHRTMQEGVLEIAETWGKAGVKRRRLRKGRGGAGRRMFGEQSPILEPQGMEDESDSKGM